VVEAEDLLSESSVLRHALMGGFSGWWGAGRSAALRRGIARAPAVCCRAFRSLYPARTSRYGRAGGSPLPFTPPRADNQSPALPGDLAVAASRRGDRRSARGDDRQSRCVVSPQVPMLFLRLRSEEVADAQRSGVRRLAAAFLAASLLAVLVRNQRFAKRPASWPGKSGTKLPHSKAPPAQPRRRRIANLFALFLRTWLKVRLEFCDRKGADFLLSTPRPQPETADGHG
jgi:hypothetical protein